MNQQTEKLLNIAIWYLAWGGVIAASIWCQTSPVRYVQYIGTGAFWLSIIQIIFSSPKWEEEKPPNDKDIL